MCRYLFVNNSNATTHRMPMVMPMSLSKGRVPRFPGVVSHSDSFIVSLSIYSNALAANVKIKHS
jgi:hypothetical protein